jgi:hypothetical protein
MARPLAERAPLALTLLSLTLALAALPACQPAATFDPAQLALGPGGMVGNGDPLTRVSDYRGGADVLPAPRPGTPPPTGVRLPDCDQACQDYCAQAALQNPVNRGLCTSLWGVGLNHRPVAPVQACRRLFVDMKGRLPLPGEQEAACGGGRSWGEVVRGLMESPDFVRVNQRRAADRFLYSTEVVSVERIYDMDRLVEKLFTGRVPVDLFAQVVSAHPVLTRRYADAGDRTEALFRLFLGRPPFDSERADMSRLYGAFAPNGYTDHPGLGMRMPDAFVRYRCLTEEGEVNEERRGECASVLWGYQEVILKPDIRAARHPEVPGLSLWTGLLTPGEWALLQAPGRIVTRDVAFWEKAVDDVLEQYLGYELPRQVPAVREELVRWLLQHQGDIRSVHYAVATSAAYLQSIDGTLGTVPAYRWTYGPMKQMDAEAWLDSLAALSGRELGACDHRVSTPEDFLREGGLGGYRLVRSTRWPLSAPDAQGQGGGLDASYAEVARTLGGCPANVVGGRFKVLSILTTATQLSQVRELCNATLDRDVQGAPAERLLPPGVAPTLALTPQLALEVARHQYGLFLGRELEPDEAQEVSQAGAECARSTCTAEQFARPLCFGLLAGAESLFY